MASGKKAKAARRLLKGGLTARQIKQGIEPFKKAFEELVKKATPKRYQPKVKPPVVPKDLRPEINDKKVKSQAGRDEKLARIKYLIEALKAANVGIRWRISDIEAMSLIELQATLEYLEQVANHQAANGRIRISVTIPKKAMRNLSAVNL